MRQDPTHQCDAGRARICARVCDRVCDRVCQSSPVRDRVLIRLRDVPPASTLRAVKQTTFKLSIVAGGGVLFIGVRVPESASDADIKTVRSTLVEAFASVEQVDEREMRCLLFDDGNPAQNESLAFILRREYSDPQYPAKIDCALQRLTSAASRLH